MSFAARRSSLPGLRVGMGKCAAATDSVVAVPIMSATSLASALGAEELRGRTGAGG